MKIAVAKEIDPSEPRVAVSPDTVKKYKALGVDVAIEPGAPPPLPDCELWHCPRCGKEMRVVQRFTAAELYLAVFDSSSPPSPTRSADLLHARLRTCVSGASRKPLNTT